MSRILAVLMLGVFSPAQALEDPTRPPLEVTSMLPDSGEPQASAMVLSGVKDNGKSSVAIVNGSMVRIGESVQGYRLVAVKGESAFFVDQGGNKMRLNLEVVDYRSKPVAIQTKRKVTGRKVSKHKHSAVQK